MKMCGDCALEGRRGVASVSLSEESSGSPFVTGLEGGSRLFSPITLSLMAVARRAAAFIGASHTSPAQSRAVARSAGQRLQGALVRRIAI